MANKIVNEIPFDFHQRYNATKAKTKQKFINKTKTIEIDNVPLQIIINSSDWDYAYKKKYLKHPCVIEPQDSIAWIERVMFGDINPKALEVMRAKEINSLDML